MHNSKSSAFQQLTIEHFNCYFSQIRQVSHCSLHEGDLSSPNPNNCFVAQEQNELLIISRGGTKFHLPMDQEVSRIYPLPEGILIEFFLKPEIKLQEVLYFQKHKNSMDIEQMGGVVQTDKQQFCYATLTRHPYNPLKVLGQFSNEEMKPWLLSREQVMWVSDRIPLLISYNDELRRSAYHILLVNVTQVNKQYQYAYIPSQTYSLKTITQVPHYEAFVQTIFEENAQGERIINVVLNKSVKKGHLVLYAGTADGDIKVYQINFYGSHNSARLMTKISNTKGMVANQLYTTNSSYLQEAKPNEGELLGLILKEQLASLSDCVAILHQNFIGYYHNGFLISTEPLNKYSVPVRLQQGKFVDSNSKPILLNSLVAKSLDSLLLKTLQMVIDDDKAMVKCLSFYLSGLSLEQTLCKVGEGRSDLLFALHLLYQEMKLYQLMGEERQKMAMLMLNLSLKSGRKEYQDYYLREGYQDQKYFKSGQGEQLQNTLIFDVFGAITGILLNPTAVRPVYSIYSRSKFILTFFQLLAWGEVRCPVEQLSRDQHSLNNKYAHSKQYFYRTRYPLLSQQVFHLSYYNTLYQTNQASSVPTHHKEQKAFLYLITNHKYEKEILSYPLGIRAVFNWLLRQMRRELPYSLYEIIPELGFKLINRIDLYKNIQLYRQKNIHVPYHLQKPSLDDHIKTLVHTSNSQEYFLTSNASEMNKLNNDLVFEEVHRLLSSTSEIKIKVKDIETIPEERWEVQSQNILIKFANRRLAIIIGQGAFNLGISRSFITDIIKIPKINLSAVMPNDIKITLDLKDDKESIIYWPEFHAGLAAGLKLSRHVIPLSQDHLKTWIFYQKPDTPKRDHSGFLLSLGLLGYLKCFSPTDIYQYLKPNNEFTSVAILLGVSASNIGKSDQALSKALILHIPVLLPPSIDVEIPINVQTSALIGIGLLHKGTCNRTMTQMALSQIGKRPSSDKCLQRQGYSLAAGWALGMICLGMRDKKESFRDLQLEQRLIRFIEGGRVIPPPQSMISTNYINEAKCSSIKEGPYVNMHITTPSALLALSLMYLKSNDAELAGRITIPNSFNTIQECNPNHILLKIIAKNLILWDSMTPAEDFIMNQIPELIRFIYQNPLNKVYQQYYLVYNVSEIDYQTITTIYLSVITGTLIAMSLRYAGTGNSPLVRIIKQHIEHLKTVKITKCQFANDPLNKNSIDQYELFSLISASLLALAVVMAGTCDIESLKLIRIIRKKFQDSKVFHYGFSMAINMAIGFIFLGYGNYTFNREDMSIAALLISIYPQFPNAPGDNRWHLQALRHFYVLAMQQKIFHTVDVDTNKVVNVAARMTFLVDGQYQSQDMHTPVLLQESKQLTHIKIIDQDYFDVDFSFAKVKSDPKAIYIKRKHFKDINPKLLNPENVLTTQITKQELKDSLTKEERFVALVDKQQKTKTGLSYLLPSLSQEKTKIILSKFQKKEDEKDLYFKLLKQDRLDMLEIYLTLSRQMQLLINSPNEDSLTSNNIGFTLSFEKWLGINDFATLIHPQLASCKQMLVGNTSEKKELQKYVLEPHEVLLSNKLLYKYMRMHGLPASRDLYLIQRAIRLMKDKKEKPENIEMLLMVTYPECSQDLLKMLLEVYFK